MYIYIHTYIHTCIHTYIYTKAYFGTDGVKEARRCARSFCRDTDGVGGFERASGG